MIWLVVVLLMAAGIVLLVAEVAIVPGVAVAGITAALLLAGGVATAWLSYGPAWGVGSLLGAGALAITAIAIAPRTRAGRALVLDATITAQHSAGELDGLLGRVGVAVTALRPSGAADLGSRRVDVVTDGQFIEAGARVKVIAVEGRRVVVAADA